eukprot:TRINITY_DN1849_c0_g1_i9.p1 TRINITY_DN1849_c0_g1~~TRINITY_DN1849_c0_g1_i9.p1  ORF type:complete len:229 (+),score=48.38 TRINITY_DN1849_c0_g1_i9:171-857(+)
MAENAAQNDVHSALSVLELTTVHYSRYDPYALYFAYITLTPLVLIVGFVTLVLFRRDLRTGSFFGGQLVNEAINYVLKKTLKEARPAIIAGVKTDYGLPSSHAQFMFFFAVFLSLALLKGKIKFEWQALQSIVPVFLLTLAGLVTASRVYLQYHTTKQVLLGCAVGTGLGVAWFWITEAFLAPYIFPMLESSSIGRFFYLRDTSHIQHLARWEYENVINDKKRQSKKK